LYLATELTPGETALEAGEQIETLITPWDEAMQMVWDGRIEDAKTLVGLLHYNAARQNSPGAP
jgi:ADP-ribose pyrophosphatase